MAKLPVLELYEGELAKKITVTIHTRIHKNYLMGFGLLVIRFGCWVCGLNYEETEE